MAWDWAVGGGILVAFVLMIWARVSKQTIPELIGNLIDVVRDKKEDVVGDVTYGYYDR